MLFEKKLSVHDQVIMIYAYSISNGTGMLLAMAQHRSSRQEFLLKHSLQVKTLELKQLAYRDSLTGALNRRAFQDHFHDFNKMAVRVKEDDNNVFLIAADLDNFKLINDSFGHDVGDKVLVAFTALIESQIRPQDSLYRFGGEKFTILLQNCKTDIAIERVEKIMHLLNENHLAIEQLDEPVTCSFGITPLHVGDTVDSVFIRADAALYKAKNNGRNQYVFDLGAGTES